MVGNVEVIEVVGKVNADGFVAFDGGAPLTDAVRSVISQALGADRVRFVPITVLDDVTHADERQVLSIAEPEVVDGRLTIQQARGAAACADLAERTWSDGSMTERGRSASP